MGTVPGLPALEGALITCSFTGNYELRDTLAEPLSPIWLLTYTWDSERDWRGQGWGGECSLLRPPV